MKEAGKRAVLKIREDRRALVRRVETARIGDGSSPSSRQRTGTSRSPAGSTTTSLSENNRIRSVKIGAARIRARPPRRRCSWTTSRPTPSISTGARRRTSRPRRLRRRRSGLPREQVALARGARPASRRSSCRSRSPRTSASRKSPRSKHGRPSTPSSRSPCRSGVSTRTGRPRRTRSGYLAEATAGTDQGRSRTPTRSATGSDRRGSRATYERLLAGVNGERRVIVDSHGREIAEAEPLEATPGQNLFLTLDLDLQGIAEDYFKDRVGTVVAMDPKTGEILALVSSPSYDPNWFTRRVTASEWTGLIENPHPPLQNRTIQNAYSPGSVFKIFLAYGALALNVVDPDARDLLPRPRHLLRTELPLPQEGRAWLGQPARRDQGVLRRVLLQPRPAPRRRPDQRGRDVVRVRGADGSRPGVREVGPRSVGRVGEDTPRRALVSERDDLGRDRAGTAARDVAAGRAGALGDRRGRAPAHAAPLLCVAGPAHGARLRYKAEFRRRCRSRRTSSRSSRTGCGPSSTSRAAPPTDRGSTAWTWQARPARRRWSAAKPRSAPAPTRQARGPRLVRGLRAGPRSPDGRRRVRRERRARKPRRGAAREGALRGALRNGSDDSSLDPPRRLAASAGRPRAGGAPEPR